MPARLLVPTTLFLVFGLVALACESTPPAALADEAPPTEEVVAAAATSTPTPEIVEAVADDASTGAGPTPTPIADLGGSAATVDPIADDPEPTPTPEMAEPATDATSTDTVADTSVAESVVLDYGLSLDGQELGAFEKMYISSMWKTKVDAALEPSECPAVPAPEYPAGYYTGPLIDTHLHMPQLDDEFGGPDDSGGGDVVGGVDADQYNEISEEDRPLLGKTVTVDQVACTLKQEGTKQAFTFFPVFPESPGPLIDVAQQTKLRHGSLFTPFIQSTSQEISTVEAEILEQMLALVPGLFDGFGEVGDSPTEPINPPPDAPIYIGDFEVAQAHGLLVWFHPGIGHHENLARAAQQFPDVKFLVHGDFVRPYIGDLMAENPNIYFTANDIFDEVIPMFRFGAKQDFVDAMRQNWDAMLDQAVEMYSDLIDTYPDRFMWGTDRADIVWNYDADLGMLLSEYGRDFIGRLDPSVQEKFAYLNAESLLQ